MKNIRLIVIAIALFLILSVIGTFMLSRSGKNQVNDEEEYTLVNGDILTFETSKNIKVKNTDEKVLPLEVKDVTTTYQVGEKDSLTLVERVLPNNDSFIFAEWENRGSESGEENKNQEDKIKFSIPFNKSNNYNTTGFSAFDIEHSHDNTVGVDKTTYPNGLIRINNFQDHNRDLMLGKNYVSELLTKEYDDGDVSFIRKFIDEKGNFNVTQNNDSVDVKFEMVSKKGQISEQWLMLSEKKLFEDKDELSEWIEISNKEYRSVNEWYTANGVYSKLPWSIEPFDEMGYGKNILYFREDTAKKRYKNYNKERYYYNLMINSLINYEKYPKNKEQLFETHYTSTWLKKDYGTKAPYVDTRHNELSAIYINTIIRDLGLDYNINPLETYADFLVKQEDLGNVLKFPNAEGYLIADYYDYSEDTQQTHTSLNHVLGEMNLLLQVYLDTGQEKYLDVANNIKNVITATEDDWIRDDHDLWYEINTKFEYTGRDYQILTLRDLLDAEYNWQTINNNKNHIFKKLIHSKIEYLKSENVELGIVVKEKMAKANY